MPSLHARLEMFKKLLSKLDQQISEDNEEWDFCDGYGTCVRWPITGGQVVKHYRLNDSIINLTYANKNVEELF